MESFQPATWEERVSFENLPRHVHRRMKKRACLPVFPEGNAQAGRELGKPSDLTEVERGHVERATTKGVSHLLRSRPNMNLG